MRVRIKGYRLQVNSKEGRICEHGCGEVILKGEKYVRVMRLGGKVEIFDVPCFEDEFGTTAVPKVAR